MPDAEVSSAEMALCEEFADLAKSCLALSCSLQRSLVVTFIPHRSVCTFIGKHVISRIPYGGKPTMTKILPPKIAKVKYHRLYADEQGGSHFDTVTVEQSLAAGAPPAAPFYVSQDGPATKHRFYTFQPGWVGDWHPCPTRQFLALMTGAVEMETTDGTKKRFMPGDLVLLEDTTGKGHVTRNIGDGYAAYLVVPVPER